MKHLRIRLVILCTALIATASIALVVMRETSYREAKIVSQTLRSYVSGELPQVKGIVQTVDETNRTLTIIVTLPGLDGMLDRIPVQMYVPELSLIAYQKLGVHEGVYDSISETQPAQLSDLRQGDRVAVMPSTGKGGRLEATAILFGLPL